MRPAWAHLVFFSAAALGSFLVGLRLMQQVYPAAARWLKPVLTRATASPVRGMAIGAAASALVHSSSVVTIATIPLVAGGLLPLENALGIILGANVGTCVTLQFLALDLTRWGVILIPAGGLAALVFSGGLRRLALAACGMGFVLLALELMATAAAPVADLASVLGYLKAWTKEGFPAFVAGIAATAVIQSSTMFISAVAALADQRIISMTSAVGLVLGSNVGTCADTLVASLWSNRAGRQVAVAHLLFNVAGALAFLPLARPFAALLGLLSDSPSAQVAHAHLLFNLTTALAALPFIRIFFRRLP